MAISQVPVPTELVPWQRRIAGWAAQQVAKGHAVSWRDAFDEAQKKAPGRLKKGAFRQMWRSPAFLTYYDAQIAKIAERSMTRAKVVAARNAPLAMKVHGQALRAVQKELQSGGDPLSAARAVPALVNPTYQTLFPRKTEATIQQTTHITLSVEQAAALEAPVVRVTAVQPTVDAEIVDA